MKDAACLCEYKVGINTLCVFVEMLNGNLH